MASPPSEPGGVGEVEVGQSDGGSANVGVNGRRWPDDDDGDSGSGIRGGDRADREGGSLPAAVARRPPGDCGLGEADGQLSGESERGELGVAISQPRLTSS